MWLFRCPVATNVASRGILLDTTGLLQRYVEVYLCLNSMQCPSKWNKKVKPRAHQKFQIRYFKFEIPPSYMCCDITGN